MLVTSGEHTSCPVVSLGNLTTLAAGFRGRPVGRAGPCPPEGPWDCPPQPPESGFGEHSAEAAATHISLER